MRAFVLAAAGVLDVNGHLGAQPLPAGLEEYEKSRIAELTAR